MSNPHFFANSKIRLAFPTLSSSDRFKIPPSEKEKN
jgi:hypothetical protein